MAGDTRWNFSSAVDVKSVTEWLHSNTSLTMQEAAAKATMSDELAIMRKAAVTIVVSSVEATLLQQLLPKLRVHVISNVHDVNVAHKVPEGCNGRHGILFVGNFNHLPNQQAMHALIEDVLPVMEAMVDPEEMESFIVHIVGSNSKVEAGMGTTRFRVLLHGWLSDLELQALYRSVKLVVAPLMSGAGVKGKINQAMLYGVPVVATPIAAEGMHLVDGVNAMLAYNAIEFAQKIMLAYRNCTLWLQLVQGGYDNIEQYYSMAAATSSVANILSQIGFAVPVPRRTFACSHIHPGLE